MILRTEEWLSSDFKTDILGLCTSFPCCGQHFRTYSKALGSTLSLFSSLKEAVVLVKPCEVSQTVGSVTCALLSFSFLCQS